jgi:hypothetical protein
MVELPSVHNRRGRAVTDISKDRAKLMYEQDYTPMPQNVGGMQVSPEARIANAAEYIAFQMGQINRKLDRLNAAAERLAGSQPDPRPFSEIKKEREARERG